MTTPPPGFGHLLDTSDTAAGAQVARWRTMSPDQKAALVIGLYRTTRRLAEAGIAARYPDASAQERFLRLAILHLGRDLAVTVYPEAAQLPP